MADPSDVFRTPIGIVRSPPPRTTSVAPGGGCFFMAFEECLFQLVPERLNVDLRFCGVPQIIRFTEKTKAETRKAFHRSKQREQRENQQKRRGLP
jgi:hypothetical protein